MSTTVSCTVELATAVSGVPIAYQLAPLSSEPSIWSAGAVVVIAPTLTTSWARLPASLVSRLGVVLLSVVSTIERSISWRTASELLLFCRRLIALVKLGLVPPTVCTYRTRLPTILISGERYMPEPVILGKSYTLNQLPPESSDSSIATSSVGVVPVTAVTGMLTL